MNYGRTEKYKGVYRKMKPFLLAQNGSVYEPYRSFWEHKRERQTSVSKTGESNQRNRVRLNMFCTSEVCSFTFQTQTNSKRFLDAIRTYRNFCKSSLRSTKLMIGNIIDRSTRGILLYLGHFSVML
jgi:hypothetical protein